MVKESEKTLMNVQEPTKKAALSVVEEGALARFPRARPEPRLVPNVEAGAVVGGALGVSAGATAGSPDDTISDMTIYFCC